MERPPWDPWFGRYLFNNHVLSYIYKRITNLIAGIFLQTRVHWLLCLECLRTWQPKPSEPYNFVLDAKRFILKFRSMIELAPLQIYNSALLFSPQASIIRNLFEKEIDGSVFHQEWNKMEILLCKHLSCIQARSIALFFRATGASWPRVQKTTL